MKISNEPDGNRNASFRLAAQFLNKVHRRIIAVRFPVKEWSFSRLHSVQTGSGAHPASYLNGHRGILQQGYSSTVEKLTTNLHLVRRITMHGSMVFSICLHGVVHN